MEILKYYAISVEYNRYRMLIRITNFKINKINDPYKFSCEPHPTCSRAANGSRAAG